MNTLALYTAGAIALLYAVYVTVRYGWQKSFSDTYYTQRLGWIFQAWCFVMALLVFIAFYKAAPSIVFASFGFMVVGFTPKMRLEWQAPIHFIGAVIIILGGCLCFAG